MFFSNSSMVTPTAPEVIWIYNCAWIKKSCDHTTLVKVVWTVSQFLDTKMHTGTNNGVHIFPFMFQNHSSIYMGIM